MPRSVDVPAGTSGQAAAIPLPLVAEGDGEDVKTLDTVKVRGSGGSDAPSGSYSSRSDQTVVRADILARSGELGPDTGVRTGGQQAER